MSERAQSGTTNGTNASSAVGESPVFVTTHWSVVRAAGQSEGAEARPALEEICRAYWHPLYHYIRRLGVKPEDAEDLTQGFFANFLERGGVSWAEPGRGRFRSFLLGCLKHYLADEWDKATARKRGGGKVLVVDFESEETRLATDPSAEITPDRAFDRRWAVGLLEMVYQRLEQEAGEQGKSEAFVVLRQALMGARGDLPHREIAEKLGISEGAARVAVHRLRQRYRELLQESIGQTVSSAEEARAELRYLLEVLSNQSL